MSKENKELYEFGDFRLDVGERRLERRDGSGKGGLAEKPFQTLVHLVRHNGKLVTKDELLSNVWPDAVVEENNLGKAIHSIRQHLGDSSTAPKYIETVPKHGYRFVAQVNKKGIVPSVKSPGPMLSASGAHAIVSLDDLKVFEDSFAWDDPGSDLIRVEPEAPRIPDTPSSNGNMRARLAAISVIAVIGIAGWFVLSKNAANGTNATPESVDRAISDDVRAAAYDRYVRGKVKVANENREDTEAATRLLQEAVDLDPTLAEAHAQLARAYNTMAFKFSSAAERKEYHENAQVEIEKALQLNPELAEAHFARGLILWTHINRFPHEQVIQAYRKSLAIDPNSDETHHQLSLVYSHIGLEDAALESVKKTLELNPNNTLARFRVGVYLQYQGKFEEGIAVFKTIPREHTPLLMDRSLAETLIQLKRFPEAEAIADDYLRRFPQDEGGSFTSVKALLLAKTGRSEEAERMALRANEIGSGFGHFHHTAHNIASVYVEIGKHDEAIAWLEKAVDTGFPNYPYFSLDPNLEKIRGNESFAAFMSQLKLRWERFKSES